MTQNERFFGNPFSSPEIIPIRLYNFGLNLHAALVADNPSGHFDDEIANVEAKLAALALEISDVDTALTFQLGSTLTVDGVVAAFKSIMGTRKAY